VSCRQSVSSPRNSPASCLPSCGSREACAICCSRSLLSSRAPPPEWIWSSLPCSARAGFCAAAVSWFSVCPDVPAVSIFLSDNFRPQARCLSVCLSRRARRRPVFFPLAGFEACLRLVFLRGSALEGSSRSAHAWLFVRKILWLVSLMLRSADLLLPVQRC
jgi:hypothetical protein